jgi:hypothetical protein
MLTLAPPRLSGLEQVAGCAIMIHATGIPVCVFVNKFSRALVIAMSAVLLLICNLSVFSQVNTGRTLQTGIIASAVLMVRNTGIGVSGT